MLERLARDKHSSLSRKSLNYGRNKFDNTGPRTQCYKTFTPVIYAISYDFDRGYIISLGLGANAINLFTPIMYKCLLQARVFVPKRPFQPSIMSASKAEAYLSEETFRRSTLV